MSKGKTDTPPTIWGFEKERNGRELVAVYSFGESIGPHHTPHVLVPQYKGDSLSAAVSREGLDPSAMAMFDFELRWNPSALGWPEIAGQEDDED
jgi:hypothetical protein